MCISENNFNVRREDIIPPKRESLGKRNALYLMRTEKCVYYAALYHGGVGGGSFLGLFGVAHVFLEHQLVWRLSFMGLSEPTIDNT